MLINGPKLSLTQGQCWTSNKEELPETGNPQETARACRWECSLHSPGQWIPVERMLALDRLILACQLIAMTLNLSETDFSCVSCRI